ncbi:MAG: 30S ribosomal protein S9 [Chloroflexi bacterium]|nr:30S ribosomal protein S9 [Chloroflexota bacterium]
MTQQHYYAGTGRRKTAVARVRLIPGDGRVIVINGKSLKESFPLPAMEDNILRPFQVTSTLGRFNASIKVAGGGVTGQADAIRHGIARALLEVDPSFRQPLKRNHLLTRDARAKERKKYGLVRARKKKQYSKR